MTTYKDGKSRCAWCGKDPLMRQYHDREWGRLVRTDRKWFEFLLLEGAQAGLNWSTILRKREAYRRAFDNFDYNQVACFKDVRIRKLLSDTGIVRNRLKIKSAVQNAQCFIEVRNEFGTFNSFIRSFVVDAPIRNHWRDLSEVPASTPLSDRLSKELKNRGFSFVGSTICYAFMQATGLVNDHTTDCFRYSE